MADGEKQISGNLAGKTTFWQKSLMTGKSSGSHLSMIRRFGE